jgi:nitrogenase molybdenum-iron protein alpha/beta subunit
MDATLKKLQEILLLPFSKRPNFIGFDVDDTLLGLRADRTKEELLKERYALAEVIAQLALERVKIVFFSDGDSQITLKRIGYPLMQLVKENLKKPITFTFKVNSYFKLGNKLI